MVDDDEPKGIVVDAHDFVAFEPLGSTEGVVDAHGEVVANGEYNEVQFVLFAKDLHVAEEGGVASVIEGALDGLDDKSAGVAAIGAVREAAAVDSIDEPYGTEVELPLAAEVHGVDFLESLGAQPLGDLPVGDTGGSGALGEGHSVEGVVGVAVGEKDVVGLDAVELDVAGLFVACDKGVEKEGFSGSLDGETGVAVEVKFHGRYFFGCGILRAKIGLFWSEEC